MPTNELILSVSIIRWVSYVNVVDGISKSNEGQKEDKQEVSHVNDDLDDDSNEIAGGLEDS